MSQVIPYARSLAATGMLLLAGVAAAQESALPSASVIEEDAEISGSRLELRVLADEGGRIDRFRLKNGTSNMTGAQGLLIEGFGTPSRYVPARQVDARLEAVDDPSGRPVLRYSYLCEGPNIDGLQAVRVMEPFPDETGMRVTWTVKNTGSEAQWLAPWVGADVLPGAAARPGDHMDLATDRGIARVNRTGYHLAVRNWIAATDPEARETFYAVFHADQLHAFLVLWDERSVQRGFQASMCPLMLRPGDTWSTTYRLAMVRGLTHVNFATDELAVQLDYASGQLVALLAATRELRNAEIEARVVAENGRVWKLPRKRFDANPDKLIRCTYDWEAPGEGAYDFLARIYLDGRPFPLGADTGSPHGGIDARFDVGTPSGRLMEAWTDAPYLLERKLATHTAQRAFSNGHDVWILPALQKIFAEDRFSPDGPVRSTVTLHMARGERESFQLCLSPGQRDWIRPSLETAPLTREGGTEQILPGDVAVYTVGYVPVRIPSHYEGPTGRWPDPLLPGPPAVAERGRNTTLWVTVQARRELPQGEYRGVWKLTGQDEPDRELLVIARVYPVELPVTPALKTDFGFSEGVALRESRKRNGTLHPDALVSAYVRDALAHRVTLREPLAFPAPGPGLGEALERYASRAKEILAAGATQLAVPSLYADAPDQLRAVQEFVRREGLQGRVFCPFAYEPEPPAWDRIRQALDQWNAVAPDIPAQVSAIGLEPFLPDNAAWWCVHTQMMDAPPAGAILQRIADGRETWWYLSHLPARPYANLFVDFTAVEHRILFWQAWAAGIRGLQYWCINYVPDGDDPFNSVVDATPVNGDGLLVYPGTDGPIPSIRWEILRDGIEDYDLLVRFAAERRRLEALEGVPRSLVDRAGQLANLSALFTSMVTFSRNPDPLLKRRIELLEWLADAARVNRQIQLQPVSPPAESPPSVPASTPAPEKRTGPSRNFNR
ncbi:MAG TPA: DUF4091 domain-containing protein [Candidatus Hydrogenedentes bacterium]|nr:DUF4091 domain-containing protein [Candidatus Hydrogenedentota bacterium]